VTLCGSGGGGTRYVSSVGNPSVGVVMPVRNGAGTIGLAVGSVLAQQPPVDHVVVVDGTSTDGTLGCLPIDPRIEVVHQSSTGLGAARNDGIHRLRTDLVGFCDADDRWRPDALAVRMDHLATHPTCIAVAGRVCTSATSAVGEVPTHRVAGLGRATDGYTPGAVLIRREVVAPFDEQLRIATDTRWFAELLDSPLRFDLIAAIVLDKGVGPATLSTDLERYRREMLVVISEVIARRRLRPAAPGERGRDAL